MKVQTKIPAHTMSQSDLNQKTSNSALKVQTRSDLQTSLPFQKVPLSGISL